MPAAAPARVAVMAHFDPDAQLADHVRRLVDQLAEMCSRVVLVTTSGIGPDGAAWAAERPELEVVQRPNVGHDFMSYRLGLEVAQVDGSSEVVICNDSFVGITVPLASVWQRMARRRCDFWGITRSTEISPHVQSYFVVFRPGVTASPDFHAFWDAVEVLPDKKDVIHSYEVGLSRRLLAAGFEASSYYSPTARDVWEALVRNLWRRQPQTLAGGPFAGRRRVARQFLGDRRDHWNPTIFLADRVLTGRLPLVKLQVFREDPAQLGASRLLTECEARFPELFSGVRSHLERTAKFYPSSAEHEPSTSLRAAFERVRY